MSALQRVAPVLPVRDVAKAIEHYRLLGFWAQPYAKEGPSGPVYGFVSSGDVELHLSLVRDLDPKTNTSACYLYVENADVLYASWISSGVGGRFTRPEDTPYGHREFVHWDLDGNLIRVGSLLSQNAPGGAQDGA
jgi:hypothetical protein